MSEEISLIQELTEARMFRGASTLSGMSANEIADIVYAMMLLVEFLRYEDPQFARNYVMQSTQYDNFKTMRNGSTDLHNLMAVLINQDDYNERIIANPHITVPLLQTKKYLRDAENGNFNPGIVRSYFLRLEGFLNIQESWMKQSRRVIMYYDTVSEPEKKKLIVNFKRFFQARSFNNDLYVYFKAKFR